jgi:hypothetical protein
MDCTHVHWDKCPVPWRHYFTGKEGYPTIAYEVICDHSGYIMSCSPGYYGACNDKTIVRFDSVIQKLKSKEIYYNVEWFVYTNEIGDKEYFSSPYVIVDGGYHNWVVTIAANDTFRSDPDYIRWQKRMESVRKDIECVFGRLKSRFRILKNPIQYQKKHQIDNIFLSCCILYNMCHVWDKLGEWERDIDYDDQSGGLADLEHESEGTLYYEPISNQINNNNIAGNHLDQYQEFDIVHDLPFPHNIEQIFIDENEVIPANLLPSTDQLVEIAVETDVTYKQLRDKLVKQF